MTLVEHAKRELALLGNDTDFDDSLIRAVEAFASYGHSGGSAPHAIAYLHELLQFKPLSPLTDDPKEWMDRTKESGYPFWQNVRDPEAFSEDGGKSYYLLSEVVGDIKPIHYPARMYIPEEKSDGGGTPEEKPKEIIDIGPQCFTDGEVISYKGANFYKACDAFVTNKEGGGQTFCTKRVDHPGYLHEDYDGNVRGDHP